MTVNEVNYEPVEQRGETTMNRGIEDLLTVQVVAETYVQPAAGGATTPTGGPKSLSGKGESRTVLYACKDMKVFKSQEKNLTKQALTHSVPPPSLDRFTN